MRKTGTFQTLGSLGYFIPEALPPKNPPFELNTEIMDLFGQASFALGQLNEMGAKLPDSKRFIRAYIIKEALLSSAIEGIHTTLIDVFTHELGQSKPNKDTQLVLNYTDALDVALRMVKDEGMPIVSRVILQAHEALMSAGEGDKASPGQFRKQMVRVGQHTPPPAQEIPRLMSELEKYINEPSETPALIRAGLAHVQFETIHPFLDGNGRIGRLLIVLMLIENDILSTPILYPSYYFKKHHLEYYKRLDRVRTDGDFEGWITYYLKAITESALDAYKRAKEIETLEVKLKELIAQDPKFVRIQENATAAIDFLFARPITTVLDMSEVMQKSYNTVSKILKLFAQEGIISEATVNKRNKVYTFHGYLNLLEKENS